ncbi:hypothetical protein ACIOMM_11590 [Streptomyces sp. NPDC087908]|uniref:hypothetical protein n=1 Tax=unclassified Streptomyces TaxID=2593676 RepID=UPI0011CE6211|nr:hypothetical protein [Streptomyces sp. adm13(2018)]TXS11329.1 hypothetical protein EAO70_30690 [Streptomyces sp. adm13(2018)]
MTVDPTDPDTFAEEAEKAEKAKEAEDGDVALDEETPEADAAEQHTELQQREDEPLTRVERDSANEADASEQARVVAVDEDDYR